MCHITHNTILILNCRLWFLPLPLLRGVLFGEFGLLAPLSLNYIQFARPRPCRRTRACTSRWRTPRARARSASRRTAGVCTSTAPSARLSPPLSRRQLTAPAALRASSRNILTCGEDTFVKVFETDDLNAEPRTHEHAASAVTALAIDSKVRRVAFRPSRANGEEILLSLGFPSESPPSCGRELRVYAPPLCPPLSDAHLSPHTPHLSSPQTSLLHRASTLRRAPNRTSATTSRTPPATTRRRSPGRKRRSGTLPSTRRAATSPSRATTAPSAW